MDDKSIISKDTFEVFKHEEDCPYAFICDKRIAPTIALLNKKGYSTFASCGGHYKNEFYALPTKFVIKNGTEREGNLVEVTTFKKKELDKFLKSL